MIRRAALRAFCLLSLFAAATACDERSLEQPGAPAAPPYPAPTSLGPEDSAALLRERGDRSEHGTAPTLGPAEARLTLVLFEDYGSPDCGRLAPLPHVLENLYPGKIRLVVRQSPFASGSDGSLAARAALAAHAQGRFWDYRDTLFANPHDHGRAALERYAGELGLDVRAFTRALDQGEYRADVSAERELGQRLRLRDVPAVFANGVRVSTPYGVNDLAKLAAVLEPAAPGSFSPIRR